MISETVTTTWRRRAGLEVGRKNVKYIQNYGRQNLKGKANLGDYKMSENMDALTRSRRASTRTCSDRYRAQGYNGRYTT